MEDFPNYSPTRCSFKEDQTSSIVCNKVYVPVKLQFKYSEDEAELEHKEFGSIEVNFDGY